MVTWGVTSPQATLLRTEPRPSTPRANILESIAFMGLHPIAPERQQPANMLAASRVL
ncbi:hypothetical protein ABIA22_002962 [Sinorhizobium fredii]